MNTNFQTFTNGDVQTKTVNGLTLILDPDLNKYVLPVSTETGKRILYDDATQQFIEVLIANGGFMYRERTASGDGVELTERVFVSANPAQPGAQTIAPNTPESINAGVLKFRQQMIDAANGVVPLLYAGTAISIVVFFWQLITNLDVIVAAITTGSTAAMSEIGYLFAWALGAVALVFVLFRGVPLLFRSGKTSDVDRGEFYTGENMNAGGNGDATVTNIFINNAKNVTGGVGNGTSAQDYINNRKM